MVAKDATRRLRTASNGQAAAHLHVNVGSAHDPGASGGLGIYGDAGKSRVCRAECREGDATSCTSEAAAVYDGSLLRAVGTIIAVLSGRPRIVDRTRVLAFRREIFLAVGSTRDALRKLPLLRSFNPTKRKKHSGHGEQ